MVNALEQSILKTIAFFDVFNQPLTAEEIWKWLYRPNQKFSLLEVKIALETSLVLLKNLVLNEAFYSLRDSSYSYLIRKHHNDLSERKFAKVLKLLKIYKYLPFIKMIAICNSLSFSNASEESDIDLFIITEKKKIWLARFFTILIVKILGLRPTKEQHRDTFCLSFFISEDNLDIENILFSIHDIYTPYWIAQLLPVYDRDQTYDKFLEANLWVKRYLPNTYANSFCQTVKINWLTKIIRQLLNFVFSPPLLNHYLDNFYRKIQSRIIARNLRELINVDTKIIVNEQMLKFHVNDRRELFYKKWRERIHNLYLEKDDEELI